MDGDGNSKDDVKIPDDEVGKGLEAGFDEGKDLMVTIVSAMGGFIGPFWPISLFYFDEWPLTNSGEEQAISFKEAPTGGA